ncbi:MAG: DegT/DnrJ/EryC1/StrS family aminotransferase [Candidatus Sphingomonas colombiensis]|nr:DegT/DnrJ/EryC1/StrS family aminotransferase [Sphingomonas sp.]WEK44392.1 MAG: DegT/DnrJ/EryC1/StrS family aminotransferase [Sphingomonas sp.]
MNFDILLSPPHMGGEEFGKIKAAFDSNWIAPTGPMVDAFEAGLAELTGISHVAALSSGTAALHLAFRLAGVGPGDHVWLPSMTFIGGVAPALYQGARPTFLDSRERDMLVDLDLLNEALRGVPAAERPKVVVTTDLYGHVVDPVAMRAAADEYGFLWVSDAAESIGGTYGAVHAGKGAHFAVFSFNGNKIITTSGGGALASDDGEMIARARYLSTQAREPAPHYEHTTYGYNYRLSNLCAAVGVGQLEVLADRVAARRQIAERYRVGLETLSGFRMTSEDEVMRANRWLTTIRIDPDAAGVDREDVRLALERARIESRPLWKPMHMQPLFGECRFIGSNVAETAFATGLCLPSGSAMTDEQVDHVCHVIRDRVEARVG